MILIILGVLSVVVYLFTVWQACCLAYDAKKLFRRSKIRDDELD